MACCGGNEQLIRYGAFLFYVSIPGKLVLQDCYTVEQGKWKNLCTDDSLSNRRGLCLDPCARDIILSGPGMFMSCPVLYII